MSFRFSVPPTNPLTGSRFLFHPDNEGKPVSGRVHPGNFTIPIRKPSSTVTIEELPDSPKRRHADCYMGEGCANRNHTGTHHLCVLKELPDTVEELLELERRGVLQQQKQTAARLKYGTLKRALLDEGETDALPPMAMNSKRVKIDGPEFRVVGDRSYKPGKNNCLGLFTYTSRVICDDIWTCTDCVLIKDLPFIAKSYDTADLIIVNWSSGKLTIDIGNGRVYQTNIGLHCY